MAARYRSGVATTNGTDTSAVHDATAGEIAAVGAKTSVVAGDFVLIEDSEDTNNKKSVTVQTLLSSGVSRHGAMQVGANVTAQVIDVAGADHGMVTTGMAAAFADGFTFTAGAVETVASVADAGGGIVTVTTGGAHGLSVGEVVFITNSTDYDAAYLVLSVPLATTITITATWTQSRTGGIQRPDALTADAGTAGTFEFNMDCSGGSAGANDVIDYFLYQNVTPATAQQQRRKYGGIADVGYNAVRGWATVTAGDHFCWAINNTTDADNVTIRNVFATAAPV